MLNNTAASLFSGLFDTSAATTISVESFLLCMGTALLLGLLLAGAYMYRTRYTKSFVATVAMLPAVVCVVIMMVNGNIGAGVICGMGYLAYAALFTAALCAILMLYNRLDFGAKKNAQLYKTLRVTIPEDLDYTSIFDDIFSDCTSQCELTQVKTTNMGSLFRLTYDLTLRDPALEKEMIDKLRVRNGNLEITVSKQVTTSTEL